jgi:PKD domain
MSVRNLLPIALLLATGLVGCTASPLQTEGSVTVTQTTSTTTTTAIPQLNAGGIGTSPVGAGIASATVFSFLFATPPSGGVPPYTVSWNFGDGGVGAGTVAAHAYAAPGNFTAIATVTDSKATSAQTSFAVSVRTVTGRWTVTFSGIALKPEAIDIVQDGTAVTATINETADGFASGTGSVSNPRTLSVSATFAGGQPAPYALTYVGTLDASLLTWTGTVTGFTACPCGFTATRPSAGVFNIVPSPLGVGR